MIGIHDVGGFHHLGPITIQDDQIFHEEWEGLAFSLLIISALQGTWTLDEFRHVIERMPPAEYINTPYYVHWLEAIETLSVRSGLLTRDQIAERQQMVRERVALPAVTVSQDPAVVAQLQQGAKHVAYVGPGARREDKPQSFKVGDRIRTRLKAVQGHTRLQRYLWNKSGVVVAYSGTYPLADTNAHQQGENPEPTYAVRFEGAELWGPDAEPNTSVTVDLFESYMDVESSVAVAA
jgi:nitrile hydratase